jgi:hypothetical protein
MWPKTKKNIKLSACCINLKSLKALYFGFIGHLGVQCVGIEDNVAWIAGIWCIVSSIQFSMLAASTFCMKV